MEATCCPEEGLLVGGRSEGTVGTAVAEPQLLPAPHPRGQPHRSKNICPKEDVLNIHRAVSVHADRKHCKCSREVWIQDRASAGESTGRQRSESSREA